MSSVPLEKLPAEWKDNESLDVLFSPLRSKQVNPRDFDRKYTFWRQSIEVYCKEMQKSSFTQQQLQSGFEYRGRQPACLQNIINEMVSNGEVIAEADYKEKLNASLQSWGAWATHLLITRPLRWSYTKMRSMVNVDNTNVVYILVAALKSAANALYNRIPDHQFDKVFTLDEFTTMVNWSGDKQELCHQLQQLQSQRMLVMREENVFSSEEDNEGLINVFVKVPKPSNPNVTITDREICLYNFDVMQHTLTENIEKLENSIGVKREVIKAHLKQGNKNTAKTILLEIKRIEKRIDSLFKRLDKISNLKQTVEEQFENKVMLDIFKTALKQMQSQRKDVNEEDVDETMADLGEVIDIGSDIQANLAQGLVSDDVDWDKELSAFLEDIDDAPNAGTPPKNSVDELATKLSKVVLPNVPTESPGKETVPSMH